MEFRLFSQLKSIVGCTTGMGQRDNVTSGASTSRGRWVTASPTPRIQLLYTPQPHFSSKISTFSPPGPSVLAARRMPKETDRDWGRFAASLSFSPLLSFLPFVSGEVPSSLPALQKWGAPDHEPKSLMIPAGRAGKKTPVKLLQGTAGHCRDSTNPSREQRGANCWRRRAEAGGSKGRAAQSAAPGSPENWEAFASWGTRAGAKG